MKTNRMMSAETYLDTAAAAASGPTIADYIQHVRQVYSQERDTMGGDAFLAFHVPGQAGDAGVICIVFCAFDGQAVAVKGYPGSRYHVPADLLTAFEIVAKQTVENYMAEQASKAATAYKAQAAGIPAQKMEIAA